MKAALDGDFDGGEAQFAGGDCGIKRVHDDLIELGAGKRLDAAESEVQVHGRLVRAIGGHGVQSIGDGDDAGHKGNLGASEAIRIAAAIQVLVVQLDAR